MESDTGICHIVAPGILIDTQVKEAQPSERTPVPANVRDRSGLIAEALLKDRREIRCHHGEVGERIPGARQPGL